MPVPVDDSLALPLGDRYVYLVSGWHDSGNVNLVQVYDVVANAWAQATPFPGRPVFGHAGGIANRTIVVCDGVAIRIDEDERRSYEMTDGCYRGEVDARDPRRIDWFALDPHPGAARYRMAAVGTSRDGGWIVFAGGTDNPYNYNGIGYDGRPSEPRADLFAYSVERAQWHELGPLEVATMDHRALIDSGDGFIIVGGMGRGREVSASVFRFDPALP
jgi:hypothetical protein